ncbi:uncharacterized protein CTRU02_212292 [Colletotrichum truncatum]|uniref:Uncharacterized protein n=1 Tax=Colletotrichum truncatum TaxID=5467 RepID=A0ACC3YN56_COLTU|nr:uncharacterized protein CTRU02_08829 [Colletotrichum truncatum]KAF6789582.1 hypothetical protein CTRU02_08829 [Colletotrichum truncatum]
MLSQVTPSLLPKASQTQLESAPHPISHSIQATYTGLQGDALELAELFKGANLHIPNLLKVFADWPLATSAHLGKLRDLFNTTLDWIIPDEKRRTALKTADLGRLIAVWYPWSAWPELEALSLLALWLFIWDDEIDVIETDVSKSKKLAQLHYQSSLAYIRRALDVKRTDVIDESLAPTNMALFGRFGDLVRDSMDLRLRERLSTELHAFVAHVAVEQDYRLDCKVPSPGQYKNIRRGTAAVMPVVVLAEYMVRTQVPETLRGSLAFEILSRETTDLIWLINDLYSLPKELADGAVLSIVPVLLHSKSGIWTLDAVVHNIMTEIKSSMERFDSAAKELMEMAVGDVSLEVGADAFITYCRHLVTGVVIWSAQSPRYGMLNCTNNDGTISVQL